MPGPGADRQARPMTVQLLTFHLDGITAGDYLAYIRDPEPPGLGHGLRSIAIEAEPLGDTIRATIVWDGAPPARPVAEAMTGLRMTAECVDVHCRPLSIAA